MPKIEWLKKEFHYGYNSGNVLSFFSDKIRRKEEKAIGGNYREVFNKALLPFLKKNSKVLELGPGKGSWSVAILKYISNGELTTIDFQDVLKWIRTEKYTGRLNCIKVKDNQYNELKNDYFDIFWSWGVLCHNNQDSISEILKNSFSKVKKGGVAIHQYGDWEKLERYGWKKGGVPLEFKTLADDEIWWPRNTQKEMVKLAKEAGWTVLNKDLGLVKRDSIIVLRKDN